MSFGCAPRLLHGIVAAACALSAAADDLRQPPLAQSAQAAPAATQLPLRPAQKLEYSEITLSRTRETLSNNAKDWTDTQIELLHQFAARNLVIGRATSSERFGLHDNTLALAAYHPLGERTTGYVELATSDTHRVLARDSLQLQLSQSLPQGWGVLGGLKHMTYNTTAVDIAELTLERYFASYRAAFSVYPSSSRTAGNATSYRFQLSHYYADENNVQLMFVRGIEVDKPTGVNTVLATPVRGIALFGRHWLTRQWALGYAVGHTVQGDSSRRAVNLGLRYRF